MANNPVRTCGRWSDELWQYVREACILDDKEMATVIKRKMVLYADSVHKKHKTGKKRPEAAKA